MSDSAAASAPEGSAAHRMQRPTAAPLAEGDSTHPTQGPGGPGGPAGAAGTPNDGLGRWLEAQARRERGVVRLEDALLAGDHTRYFGYRLRFFLARTGLATAVHAIRIAVLFGAFTRADFLIVIMAGALVAIVGDGWWGALERMRGRIRVLQSRGTRHLVPVELAAWLRLAARLSVVGLVVAGVAAAWWVLMVPGSGPAGAMVVIILVGAALEFTVRTFHSGAYALRRVYRPLPSLIVADVAALGVLLAGWPLLGAWAFPLAELVALVAVLSLSLRFTGQTYRTLGFPSLRALLRMRVPMPAVRVLRGAIAPGVAYALVGLESIIVMAVVLAPTPTDEAAFIALLAALTPVIRAGFEWARLLYFDLVRLGVPLLADLRRRFDRAVGGLALVMGVATWLVAVLVGAIVLGVRDGAALLALLAFCVARSVLAAAQMRAFVAGAYRRLGLVGAGGAVSVGLALMVAPGVAARLLVLAIVLAGSALLLRVLSPPVLPVDRVTPLTTWLAALTAVPRPLRLVRIQFDRRSLSRGVPQERRAAEAWRRRQVARRIGRTVAHAGGMTTWLSETQVAFWVPAAVPVEARPAARATAVSERTSDGGPTGVSGLDDPARLARLAGGLVEGPARSDGFQDGAEAAAAVLRDHLGVDPGAPSATLAAVLAEFARRFPEGSMARAGHPAPAALASLESRDRASVLRAALRFAAEPAVHGRAVGRLDVSALTADGALVALFVVPRDARRADRQGWRRMLRDRTLRSAAGML